MIVNKTSLGRRVTALLFTILIASCGGGGDAPTTSYTLPSVINAVPAQQ